MDITRDPDYAVIAGRPRSGPRRTGNWFSRLYELEAFVKAHGRPPSQYGSGEERRLYYWLSDTRTEPVAEAVIVRRVPIVPVREVGFRQRVRQLKDYRDAYGRWPAARSPDEAVKSLALWVNTQRTDVRGGSMPAGRKQLLDAQVPGWDETVQATWERTVQEIATFRSHRGRMPSSTSPEHSERRFARWLSDFRRGRNLTKEREAFLDANLPGWRLDGRFNAVRALHAVA